MFGCLDKIVIASNNKHKIAEINALLAPLNIITVSQSEFGIADADETGTTFIENAIIKAKHASKLSGLPALADDSGIMVDALNGKPGVRSARFAGEQASDQENNAKLLNAMQNVEKRDAQFICVMALILHAEYPLPLIAQGVWHGEVTKEMVGEFGFGYDSLFYIVKLQKTAAQITMQQKSQYSHRALALSDLLQQLNKK